MGKIGNYNGTVYFQCPFCGKTKGVCNFQKIKETPKNFPNQVTKTSHTIACFKKKLGDEK